MARHQLAWGDPPATGPIWHDRAVGPSEISCFSPDWSCAGIVAPIHFDEYVRGFTVPEDSVELLEADELVSTAHSSNAPPSLQGIEVVYLAEHGDCESRLDLPLVFQASVHRLEKGCDSATAADVDRLTSVVYRRSLDSAGHFDAKRYSRFRTRMLSLSSPRHSYLRQTRELQAEGVLRELESSVIVLAMISAWKHLEAPRRFLARDSFPDIKGREREALSELLFWTDVVLGKRKSLFQWWHLSWAVAAACVPEIQSRLAQHPTSRDVYTLVSQDSAAALNALLRRVRGRTRDLDYRDNLKGEKDSELLLHIWTAVDSKIERGSSDKPMRSPWLRDFKTLWLAMDGKFNILPRAVRNRFIDSLKWEYRQKRGGAVPAFLPMTIEGEPDSEQESDDRQSPRQPNAALVEHEKRDVWKRVTYNPQVHDLRKIVANPTMVKKLGPAMKLVRFYLTHPEEDFTDVKLASRLKVTDKTIRNYRKRLEILRQKA